MTWANFWQRQRNRDKIAILNKAAYLVTGDSDLLDIKSYRDIKIITPRDFEALFV
jgi:predicted nucleic acid-binding protein